MRFSLPLHHKKVSSHYVPNCCFIIPITSPVLCLLLCPIYLLLSLCFDPCTIQAVKCGERGCLWHQCLPCTLHVCFNLYKKQRHRSGSGPICLCTEMQLFSVKCIWGRSFLTIWTCKHTEIKLRTAAEISDSV